jgi:hypothetical protein
VGRFILSWAQKNIKTKIKPKTQQEKQITRNANLSLIQKLKTQRRKTRTHYMLEDDSNMILI